MLIACSSLPVMQQFKHDFLASFDVTDDGEATDYLGCKVIRDWAAGTITIRQKGYILRVLKECGITDVKSVNTPLSPGICLSKRDSPVVVDPALQCSYSSIIGYVGFLVQMTSPDLAHA